jgi:hypothetical protein
MLEAIGWILEGQRVWFFRPDDRRCKSEVGGGRQQGGVEQHLARVQARSNQKATVELHTHLARMT